MFTADISWGDPHTETVGQRRERKAHERSASMSTKSTPSVYSSSSKGSAGRRSFFRALRKGKAESIKSLPQPKEPPVPSLDKHSNSGGEKGQMSCVERAATPLASIDAAAPTQLPLSHKRSLLKLQPDSEGFEALVTNEFNCPGGNDVKPTQDETDVGPIHLVQPPDDQYDEPGSKQVPRQATLMSEIREIQHIGEMSSVERVTTAIVEVTVPVPVRRGYKFRGESFSKVTGIIPLPLSTEISELVVLPQAGAPLENIAPIIEFPGSFEKLQLNYIPDDDNNHEDGSIEEPPLKLENSIIALSASHRVHCAPPPPTPCNQTEHKLWEPPAEWDSNPPPQLDVEANKGRSLHQDAPPAYKVDEETVGLTHLQRFIRRMENAGVKVILDRVKEEWSEADAELDMEKHLWVLTAFNLQVQADPDISPVIALDLAGTEQKNKILALYGHDADAYLLSSLRPSDQIHFLTTREHPATDIPPNVSYLSVPQAGIVPLPYGHESFTHICSSSLCSLVASNKIPSILSECYRLLKPGGMLEIRIIDALPVGKSLGPKMRAWFEEHLEPSIDCNFRCAKPSVATPHWLQAAGFTLADSEVDRKKGNNKKQKFTRMLRYPAVVQSSSSTVEYELSVLVARRLWQDAWGPLVVQGDECDEPLKWWWEIPELVEECRRCRTYFEIGFVVAFKL